jgi:hypothetical protein
MCAVRMLATHCLLSPRAVAPAFELGATFSGGVVVKGSLLIGDTMCHQL